MKPKEAELVAATVLTEEVQTIQLAALENAIENQDDVIQGEKQNTIIKNQKNEEKGKLKPGNAEINYKITAIIL